MRRLLLAACVVLGACGPGNALSGSISEAYNLDFDYVRVRGQAASLIIEYVQVIAGGENKVLKITVEGHRLVFIDGMKIPFVDGLVLEEEFFDMAVFVGRNSGTGSDFPRVEAGRLAFSALQFTELGAVTGTLDAVFVNGRTLNAGFAGELEVVNVN